MSLVRNERWKLLANALDRASTACIAVGVFGPAVAALYDLGGASAMAGGLFGVAASAFWLVAAVVLHFLAQYVLGRLKWAGSGSTPTSSCRSLSWPSA